MITDKETNTVWFSELLKHEKYGDCSTKIESALCKHSIDVKWLPETKDIWCRDYMPLQIAESRFVQFKYHPSYLQGYEHLKTDPGSVTKRIGIETIKSDINLDGGNVVRVQNKVIVTDRIFSENPNRNPRDLISQLEKELECRVLIIPSQKGDMTGHADGHTRFVNENLVLVNQLDQEYKYWREGFLKTMKGSGIDYIELPWFEYKPKSGSAIGVYVNYLEVGNAILFPVFEVKGNKDHEALKTMEKVFPERVIEPININEVAQFGGLLNCVSWAVKF